MLAWSAVAQAGFVLAPMVALAVRADVVLTAPLRYLAVYAMATLTVFAVAAVAARRFGGPRTPTWPVSVDATPSLASPWSWACSRSPGSRPR